MPCFGGVFRHWLRGLRGLGDAGGGEQVSPFERSSDRPAMRSIRQADADIPIARASRAPGGVVVGSRLASIHLEAPESA